MIRQKRLEALDIADYFFWKAAQEKKTITNKKLQKLLYYSQAWFLVLKKKSLFADKIEAWVHGPAIRQVYLKYKRFGFEPIVKGVKKDDLKKIPSSTQDFLNEVWRVYGKFDASYLEQLSHSEAPWQEAREGLGPQVGSDSIITNQSMSDFYSMKLKGV